ncbi:MAG TPA: alpha/beta fold hydrolase [Dehalococcoidia bacterium]|jgi:pimeloyl-ACP methyl ester carboxylesterase
MIFDFGGCRLDLRLFTLTREGQAVAVEPQVFDVLAYLVQNHDRVVTRAELIEQIWPGSYVSEAALDTRVMAARRAIGDDGRTQALIRTVRGRGFRVVAPVSRSETPSAEKAVEQPGGRSSETIQFCSTADGVRIAYAIAGKGPPLVKAANWLSHLDYDASSPLWRHWIDELSRERTLIRYDERGCGLSDWDAPALSFDGWVRDLEAVVRAADVDRFALVGISQGGAVAIDYATRHPERVTHLVLYGAYARGWKRRGLTSQQVQEQEALVTLTREGWARDNPAYRQIFASQFVPEASSEQVRWFNDICHVSASAENAARILEAFGEIDVEDRLQSVKVPTLVLHSRGDLRAPFEWGRRLAAGIPGARFVALESANHILLEDEPAWATLQTELRRFLA